MVQKKNQIEKKKSREVKKRLIEVFSPFKYN